MGWFLLPGDGGKAEIQVAGRFGPGGIHPYEIRHGCESWSVSSEWQTRLALSDGEVFIARVRDAGTELPVLVPGVLLLEIVTPPSPSPGPSSEHREPSIDGGEEPR
jgi:hypothetical protein